MLLFSRFKLAPVVPLWLLYWTTLTLLLLVAFEPLPVSCCPEPPVVPWSKNNEVSVLSFNKSRGFIESNCLLEISYKSVKCYLKVSNDCPGSIKEDKFIEFDCGTICSTRSLIRILSMAPSLSWIWLSNTFYWPIYCLVNSVTFNWLIAWIAAELVLSLPRFWI